MTDLDGLVRSHPVVQQLLGCAWGRRVATPDDNEPCPDPAHRIVVVHDGPTEHELKLCPRHFSRVLDETTPSPDDREDTPCED